MNTDDKQTLIARQLKDIISQAGNIVGGNDANEAIEAFSKYSEELKNYLLENSSNEMILERLEQVPYIDFKKLNTTGTSAVLGSSVFGAVDYFRNYNRKKKIIGDIRTAQGIYSSIEFLYRSEMS